MSIDAKGLAVRCDCVMQKIENLAPGERLVVAEAVDAVADEDGTLTSIVLKLLLYLNAQRLDIRRHPVGRLGAQEEVVGLEALGMLNGKPIALVSEKDEGIEGACRPAGFRKRRLRSTPQL